MNGQLWSGCVEPFYLEKGFNILIKAPFIAGDFAASSSLCFVVLPAAKVNSIRTKTGTSNNKNGDVFAKVFMVYVFNPQEACQPRLMKQIE